MQTLKSTLPMIFVCFAFSCGSAFAQTGCTSGYRVVSRHYDAELRKTWELRQDCAHPDWPARTVATAFGDTEHLTDNPASPAAEVSSVPPLLVHAGEPVRLWSQDATSRIEITGIAEQSARAGERINVRISHQSSDSGLTIQHIAGIVRAADSVEITQ